VGRLFAGAAPFSLLGLGRLTGLRSSHNFSIHFKYGINGAIICQRSRRDSILTFSNVKLPRFPTSGGALFIPSWPV
jgi:hypothetical protein